jgi:predicted dehydrogenase
VRELSVGIIGYGFMGRTHTFGYVNLPQYYEPLPVRIRKIVVATTSDKNVALAQASGYYEKVVRDWRQLIDDKSLDVIHVCTPNFLHAEMLRAAIDAGKYIYCDKPVTARYAEARQVADLIRSTGYRKTNQMCFHIRFFPSTLRAKQLAEEGFLGDLLGFRARFLHASNVDPARPVSWKSDKVKGGGGVILDLGSHVIDLVTHLAGPVRRLRCQTRNFTPVRPDGKGGQMKTEGEELAILTVELENGALGTVELSKVATGASDEMRFEIHGRRGAMRYDQMRPDWLSVYDLRVPETPLGGARGWTDIDCIGRYDPPGDKFPGPKVVIGWLRAHVHCLYNFVAAVAEDRPAEPDLTRGIEVQKWLHWAYRSAETDQWMDEIRGEE